MATEKFNIDGQTFAYPVGRSAVSKDENLNYIKIKLKKDYPEQANTYGRISGIAIEEQKFITPNGIVKEQDINNFSFNGDDLNYNGKELKLEYVEFFDKFTMRRNSGSGGTGDAADRFSVESLLLDRNNLNAIIESVEIMESISDTYDIPIDDKIDKRKSFKEVQQEFLNDKYALGWNLKDLGATEIQLFNIDIEIRFYFKGGL